MLVSWCALVNMAFIVYTHVTECPDCIVSKNRSFNIIGSYCNACFCINRLVVKNQRNVFDYVVVDIFIKSSYLLGTHVRAISFLTPLL